MELASSEKAYKKEVEAYQKKIASIKATFKNELAESEKFIKNAIARIRLKEINHKKLIDEDTIHTRAYRQIRYLSSVCEPEHSLSERTEHILKSQGYKP